MVKTFKDGKVHVQFVTAKADNGTFTGMYSVNAPSFSISEPGRQAYPTERDCMIAMVKKAGEFIRDHVECAADKERESVEKVLKKLRKYYAGFFQTSLFCGE